MRPSTATHDCGVEAIENSFFCGRMQFAPYLPGKPLNQLVSGFWKWSAMNSQSKFILSFHCVVILSENPVRFTRGCRQFFIWRAFFHDSVCKTIDDLCEFE